MMKSINISTKITLLIFLLSLVAVTAISFFTYDYLKKANQEKYTTTLSVIADNRAGYMSTYLDKAITVIRTMQESDIIKSGGQTTQAAPTEGGDLMAMMGGEESTAEDTTTEETSSSCRERQSAEGISYQTKRNIWIRTGLHHLHTGRNCNLNRRVRPEIFSTLTELPSMKHRRIFTSASFRPDSLDCFAAAPITTPSGQQLLIIKLDLKPAFAVIKDQRGMGQTGEVILAQFNPFSQQGFSGEPTER
jgi:hypothetical protein